VARYDRKDHFHQRAKREGFRSRAAYKLAEIQRGQRLLATGSARAAASSASISHPSTRRSKMRT
jgi:23S rRNA U2552 (ribose-2'-O)-methylase RlmE/FtsJ